MVKPIIHKPKPEKSVGLVSCREEALEGIALMAMIGSMEKMTQVA